MTGAQARAQLESVQWDAYEDQLSGQPARAVARKRRVSGVSEAVLVELDRPDGQVRLIVYEVAPALYSRKNLQRFLLAAFGRAEVVTDDMDHLTYRFAGAAPGDGLLVDAVRLGPGKSRWRLHYQFRDARLASTGPRIGEDQELIVIWPRPIPAEQELHEIAVPGGLRKGLKQIYPEPETQPAEPP
jgi:hypothetical protein